MARALIFTGLLAGMNPGQEAAPPVPVMPAALTLDRLFSRDRVLDVRITLAEADWDTIRSQTRNLFTAMHKARKEAPIPSPYQYVDGSVTLDGVAFAKVGIRKKGFLGSQSRRYPSLKIKLNHRDKAGGIGGLTSLTFNNNRQDPALVSQFMSYALFRAAGSPAPRCAFARVWVNGVDLGIYSHVESVRRPLIEDRLGSAEGTLFEATAVDFYPGWEGSFEREFGDDELGRKRIRELTEVLAGWGKAGSTAAGDEAALAKLVDLDAFYTYWAVEGLLGFWDGYSGNANNYFVYLHPKSNRFHFLPWGTDSMFQKHSPLVFDPRAPLSVKTKGLVAHRLYQLPAGRQRYARTLKHILKTHWDERALLAETDRIEAMLKPQLDRQASRFARSLARVRRFIRDRRADIEDEIEKGMPVWAKEPDPPFVFGAQRRRR